LNVLKQAKVLNYEKVGKEVQFWINQSMISEALHRVQTYIQTQT